jgi:hypothetical protein
MSKKSWKIAAAVGLLCVSIGTLAAAQLGSILKGGVIVLAVDKFGNDINKAINGIMGQKNLQVTQATKVVPILSLGDSGYIGAVQVAGPKLQVEKVKAVVQLEGRFSAIGGIRLRALVPVSSKNTSSIRRVNGVGVSAIVDFKL